MKTLKIGNVVLKNRYILAPMAGISDLPFRLICEKMGAGMTCTEMVSAKALTYKNKKTFEMLEVGEKKAPVSLQLFGSEPETMAQAVKIVEEYPFDIIDINMGCPVPKVVKNGEGSALLKNPILSGKIIEAMVKATDKPITVKIRIGFDRESINACQMAKIAYESGAKAITVHGRTREQYYEGKACWEEIAKVVDVVDIPVIGNGDLFSPEDVEEMERQVLPAGFAIARAAKGNPWIFKELCEREAGSITESPSLSEIIDMILFHCEALISQKGEYIGIREMRKHAAWYLAGKKNASKIRMKLNGIETYKELEDLLLLLT